VRVDPRLATGDPLTPAGEAVAARSAMLLRQGVVVQPSLRPLAPKIALAAEPATSLPA
jgi:hypothetical protein